MHAVWSSSRPEQELTLPFFENRVDKQGNSFAGGWLAKLAVWAKSERTRTRIPILTTLFFEILIT